MATEKRTTDIRQDEIARAALMLIGTRGMKGLQIAAVAKKVGIVPSGIYRHFRSKDEILDAVLAFIKQRLNANVSSVAKIKGDALTRMQALLMKHVDLIRENESLPMVIFSAEVYTDSPHRRKQLHGIIDSYLAAVAALVKEGQCEDVIRGDVDPAAAAVLFMGLILPPAILRGLSAGKYDLTLQSEAAWPMFCRAIGKADKLPKRQEDNA